MEYKILDTIKDLIDTENCGELIYPEDAVAIKTTDNYLVVNIDGWVASTDRPPLMDEFSCGYRAAINAISDVITKGAVPENMIVSISLSFSEKKNLRKYLSGVKKAADEYNINYLGGDLNQARDTVIDVTIFGHADQLIKRNGAQIGDIVCWIGPPMGITAAALGILIKSWKGDRQIAASIMNEPKLFPNFLKYHEMLNITSSIDCSDGLATSLHMISKSSKVGISISNLPSNQWVNDIATNNNKQLHDLIFFGGEELGIIFTCKELSINYDDEITIIGKITKGTEVIYNNEPVVNIGWEHFTDLSGE